MRRISIITSQQYLLYLAIISVFWGDLLFSMPISSIHLSPFRLLLLFLLLLFVGNISFINHGVLNLSHIKVKPYLQFLAFWLAYAFLSLMWAADKDLAIKNIIFLFIGISIVFLLVYYFREKNNFKYLYWLWLLVFITLIPLGFWELTTGNHLIMSNLLDEDQLVVKFIPTAVFHNTNDFATYIALTLPMILVWIRYYPNLYSRVLGITIFTLGLILLIVTRSRSNYIAVSTGIIFWFIVLVKFKSKMKILAITAICFLLFVFFFADDTAMLNIKDILTIGEHRISSMSGTELQGDLSISRRQNLIKNALYFTIQSVGFGVGVGNIEYYMAEYPIYPVDGLVNVHNWWAEILANYGVFIFVGYLILYVSLLLNLYRVYRKVSDRTVRMICEALLIGWVGFFMGSGASSSIISFAPQWIYLGFILAFLNYVRISETALMSKCVL